MPRTSKALALQAVKIKKLLDERKEAAALAAGHAALKAAKGDPEFARAFLKAVGGLPKSTKLDIVHFWDGIKPEKTEPEEAEEPPQPKPQATSAKPAGATPTAKSETPQPAKPAGQTPKPAQHHDRGHAPANRPQRPAMPRTA